ncbi:MAG: response regulator transcription factor [Methyloglobulus sp.]|nr:response regulator transcription factor [Methyloglobulus sp.]
MVNKWRVLLVDDEPLARLGLKNSLIGRHPDFEVVGEAGSAAEAWKLIEQDGQIHGVFLDINIQAESERSGLDLAFALNHLTNPPWIIFVTGYAEHALEAHEIHAVGYLVKPLETIKMDNMLEWIRKNRPAPLQGRIAVRYKAINRFDEKEWHTEFVSLDEILYVHKNKSENTMRVHLAVGTILDGVNGTLASWGTQLSPHGFLKIGKSCIVNLKHARGLKISQIGPENHLLSLKNTDELLPVSGDYLEKLTSAMKKI